MAETAVDPVAGPAPLLEVNDLRASFVLRRDALGRVRTRLHAVRGIDLHIAPGETLGLVGESGSGKSTVARLVLGLLRPDAGTVRLSGQDLGALRGRQLRAARARVQMVFQDPYASLNPAWTIADIVAEPLRVHGVGDAAERDDRVVDLLGRVGLDPSTRRRSAHEFSGGQRQRVAIARALALDPALVVCDEAVSALDVSTKAQTVRLLRQLRDELGLAYLFIAHDLPLVRVLSHRTAVLYLGQVMELGPAGAVGDDPVHPYTQALASATPVPDPRTQRSRPRIVLAGEPPSAADPPAGCPFASRCPEVVEICRTHKPELRPYDSGRVVACHQRVAPAVLASRPTDAARPVATRSSQ